MSEWCKIVRSSTLNLLHMRVEVREKIVKIDMVGQPIIMSILTSKLNFSPPSLALVELCLYAQSLLAELVFVLSKARSTNNVYQMIDLHI